MAYRAEQISLNEIDEQLDNMVIDQYQENLDRITMIEKAMGINAIHADEFISNELVAAHEQASNQTDKFRGWLLQRGLINNEELA